MNRREFLAWCAKAGLSASALCAMQELPIQFGGATAEAIVAGIQPQPQPAPVTSIDLTIKPALKEMADTQLVNVWAFQSLGEPLPSVPGPVLVVVEGQTISLRVTNNNTIPHRFAIQGYQDFGLLAPNTSIVTTFTAPPAGTYFYLDPSNAPVNRVMGLHGALVSLRNPALVPPGHAVTPFANPTPQVQALFDDLGTPSFSGATHFPGDRWDPTRSWVWLFGSFDPAKNLQAQTASFAGVSLSPADFTTGYLPRYFTISGKQGVFLMEDPNISPWGNVGMPALIRSMNAGLNTFSPHIHGNHVYWMSEAGQPLDNLWWVDTWTLEPGSVKDMLHPFIIPPDMTTFPPPPQTNGRGTFSQFPLIYPMHCHIEMSQTAAGGNYPWGAIVHWTILTGDVGGPVRLGTAENPQLRFEPFPDLFASA